jgi:hypothetical protein
MCLNEIGRNVGGTWINISIHAKLHAWMHSWKPIARAAEVWKQGSSK